MVFPELIRYRESDKGRDKRAGARARAARKGEQPVPLPHDELRGREALGWMDDPSRGEGERLADTPGFH